jgi:peptide-methionine (S)-S-oxide reductase
MKILPAICALCVICTACGLAACSVPAQPIGSGAIANGAAASAEVAGPATPTVDPQKLETATLAGGCFWSMQRVLDAVPGVITTTVGYTGGSVPNPSYEQVSTETTGHAESVEVVYDSTQISYAQLLDAYWHDIDPVAADGQFCDFGPSYRTAIFYHDAEQQRLAEASKQALAASGRFDQPIVTEIVAAGAFYPAEEYHQKFYLKNPDRYAAYRAGCGRDERLYQIWGSTSR